MPPHRRAPRIDLDEKITLASDVSAPELLRRMLGVEDASEVEHEPAEGEDWSMGTDDT